MDSSQDLDMTAGESNELMAARINSLFPEEGQGEDDPWVNSLFLEEAVGG